MRLKVRSAAASLLVALPGLTHALGLGDIHLKSPLNAPLDAEIELVGATAEELAGLSVQIASRDLFSRYGLDYPAFLSSIQLRTTRSADGRDVIQLSSSAPMTEPFATLLIEANVARQRIVREYTVLFDPPVFAPAATSAPAPVAAPVTGAGQRSGDIQRSETAAPAAAPPAAPRAPAAAAPAAAPGSYTVRPGDSLSAVSRRVADGSERAMIAIYQTNPEAFDGNINLLRSGSVLRIPDAGSIGSIDPGEARREVRRQSAAWASARGAAAPAVQEDPRLRLVPPGGTAAQGAAEGGDVQALRDQVSRLESELAESRRLLELRNAELARLSGTGAAPAPAEEIEAPALPDASVATEVEAPAAEPEVEAAPVTEAVAAPVPQAPAEPGLLDRLKEFWYVPVGLLALLLALLGLKAARRKRERELDAGLASFGASAPEPSFRDTSSNTLPLRKPVDTGEAAFVVEESGTHQRPNLAAQTASLRVDIDDDSVGTGSMPVLDPTAALEQGDPLAEADFHMAYGLYDQAADLVRLAIEREPQRRDLRLKLLEVFFVWGNKDQFLLTARELADTRHQAEQGEWEKIVIMGKQLAPEDPLFSNSATHVGQGSVDLNLEGGQNLIDFDLHGEPSVSLTPDGGVDLDLSGVLGEKDPTGNSEVLDFQLDDPNRGNDPARTATTRQMVQPGFEEGVTLRFEGGLEGHEGPTVEQPRLEGGETLRQKLDAQTQFVPTTDQTAELALDDLGLDLGKLDATGSELLDDSRISRALDEPDAPTLIAGLGDTSRNLIADDLVDEGNQLTELVPLSEFTSPGENAPTQILREPDFAAGQATEIMPLTDALGDPAATSRLTVLDFELGEGEPGDAQPVNIDATGTFDATGTQPSLVATDFGLDLDVGAPEQAAEGGEGEYARTQRIDPEEILLPGESSPTQELEPITMSEVGTKLDLARAYMDMGDPDGARSILGEVLLEGSPSQKQEAQRLIDSIPG